MKYIFLFSFFMKRKFCMNSFRIFRCNMHNALKNIFSWKFRWLLIFFSRLNLCSVNAPPLYTFILLGQTLRIASSLPLGEGGGVLLCVLIVAAYNCSPSYQLIRTNHCLQHTKNIPIYSQVQEILIYYKMLGIVAGKCLLLEWLAQIIFF